MAFRDRLLATIRGARPVLEEPGVLTARPADLDELEAAHRRLRPELGHTVRSNLTILSLMQPRPGMPDPRPQRAGVAALLRRLEAGDREP